MHLSNLLFTAISLLFILYTYVTTTVVASELDNMCGFIAPSTMSKVQCLSIFNLDPRSSKAGNYYDLGQIIIDILTSRVSKLENSISDSMKGNSNYPDVQRVLQLCSLLYKNGDSMLKKVKQKAAAKDYYTATDDLRSYFDNINEACINQINKIRALVPNVVATGMGEVASINYCAVLTENMLKSFDM